MGVWSWTYLSKEPSRRNIHSRTHILHVVIATAPLFFITLVTLFCRCHIYLPAEFRVSRHFLVHPGEIGKVPKEGGNWEHIRVDQILERIKVVALVVVWISEASIETRRERFCIVAIYIYIQKKHIYTGRFGGYSGKEKKVWFGVGGMELCML